ncbi:MAG: hypothetical protein QGG65_06345 [Gammaproteobacteria bacterium]|nr:hypothetical protein [Gammaproteobacteria bacterium]
MNSNPCFSGWDRYRNWSQVKSAMRVKCRLPGSIIFSLVACLTSPLVAAEPDVDYWSSYAGAEIDGDGGSFLLTGLSYWPSESTLVGLDISYANNADDYKMGYTSLLVSHDFGPAALTVGASWIDTEDFGNRTRFSGAMAFTPGPWRLDFIAQVGHEDFDPFLVNETPGSVSKLPMMADCEWDQAILGINLGWTGARWRVYVGGDHYDYDNLRCNYSSTTTKKITGIAASKKTDLPVKKKPDISVLRPTRDLLAVKARPPARLIAGNTTDVLGSFQDHSLNAGVSYQFDVMLAGVDWYWSEEVIDNFETTIWLGYVLFPLSKTTNLELSAGIETGDLEDALVFIGGRFFWFW